MHIADETLVEAPPDVVFATAIDVSNWPRFISGIEGVDVPAPGPVTVGSVFRETRPMFGKQATEEMTVALMQAPSRLQLTARNHGTAYIVDHAFAADGSGTRMTLVFTGRPTTLLARILAPLGWLFRGTVKRQLEADLADLKREAERRHQGA
jgi:hypothetical protein